MVPIYWRNDSHTNIAMCSCIPSITRSQPLLFYDAFTVKACNSCFFFLLFRSHLNLHYIRGLETEPTAVQEQFTEPSQNRKKLNTHTHTHTQRMSGCLWNGLRKGAEEQIGSEKRKMRGNFVTVGAQKGQA